MAVSLQMSHSLNNTLRNVREAQAAPYKLWEARATKLALEKAFF
jgi:hypothetical protein